jgi:dolichol-phosphate mannosyltransferase
MNMARIQDRSGQSEAETTSDIDLSVVVPVYNEQEVLLESYRRLSKVLSGMEERYELIFVDDGSRDATRAILRELARRDPNVRFIGFSRNFGHQAAITAGVDASAGKAVVIIDADLQDPPELIPRMVAKWKEGYEVVYGKRTKRKGETAFKKITAALFYRVLRAMANQDIPVDAGDFRLLDRRICRILLENVNERCRYMRGLVSWMGFRQTFIEYEREERFAGVTKYPLKKMVRLAMDAITAFTMPLKIATWVGFSLSGLSFLYLLVNIYLKLFTDVTWPGWTSLIVVSLFFNGVILIMLGLMGEYIARIIEEVKGRPLYLVAETGNMEERAFRDNGDLRRGDGRYPA